MEGLRAVVLWAAMPAERQILVMLERVRELLGAHPDIMAEYLFYRSELEFQRARLDRAEIKALDKFDRLLWKHRAWIAAEVYAPESLAEARAQFDPGHWWWYLDQPEVKAQG